MAPCSDCPNNTRTLASMETSRSGPHHTPNQVLKGRASDWTRAEKAGCSAARARRWRPPNLLAETVELSWLAACMLPYSFVGLTIPFWMILRRNHLAKYTRLHAFREGCDASGDQRAGAYDDVKKVKRAVRLQRLSVRCETKVAGPGLPIMSKELQGSTIAILVADGFEQVELTEPRKALDGAGARTVLISPKGGQVQGMNHDEKGDMFDVDQTLDSVAAQDFDALLLPGGVANPDKLRTIPAAVKFVSSFASEGKPIAAICHGPWMLVEAGAVKGRPSRPGHRSKRT